MFGSSSFILLNSSSSNAGIKENVRGVAHNMYLCCVFDQERSADDLKKDPIQKLVILSNQLSGAHVLCQLFSQENSTFQVVEPLDGVFVTLYGTPLGWNVPSDIFSFWNGTNR